MYANVVDQKTFDHWLDENGVELYEYGYLITSNMTFTPVYVDTEYNIYYSTWNYDGFISVDGGEQQYSGEFMGKFNDSFVLTTTPEEGSECNVFIGWYLETYIKDGLEYILISEEQTLTYVITGGVNGTLFAVWTEGENPFIKKYVDIRMTNGFVMYGGGEISSFLDNAYSVISLSNYGRVIFLDNPLDEIKYSMWDIAYRYELEGELVHDMSESYEDEYGFYPAEYWVDSPEYSYPDGVIHVTGVESFGDESGEIIPEE